MKLTTLILLLILIEFIYIQLQILKENSEKNIKSNQTSQLHNPTTNSNFSTPSNINEEYSSRANKIKEKVIEENVEDEMVKDIVFSITNERLDDIDKQEEEQNLLNRKINFKKLIENQDVEEELTPVDIDYNAILDNDFKINLAQDLVNNTEHNWFDDSRILKSNVEIPKKEFKVIEYSF